MTALTLVPHPDRASVGLSVTGAAAGVPTITRTDRNGSAPVRLRVNDQVIGGSMLTEDYECALTGPVTYQVRDAAGGTATASLPGGLGVGRPWLSHPGLPALNVPVSVIDDDPSWAQRSTVHDVYGRPDPVVTIRPQSWATGTITYHCPDWAQVQAVRGVYDSGTPVLLRLPCRDDSDHYHVGTVAAAPHRAAAWSLPFRVTVQFVDCAAPAGDLTGTAGWDYADGLAYRATYAADRVTFPTYAAREAGPAP